MIAVLVIGVADRASVGVHGSGRALQVVEPDFADMAVRVRGDGVVVKVVDFLLAAVGVGYSLYEAWPV